MNKGCLPIACALLALPACQDDAAEEPAIIRAVRFMQVQADEGSRQRVFAGVAQAGQESRLSFRVAGRVMTVPVKIGDTVKKGQTIAKLDPADYQLQLQEARAAAAQSRAQARNAEATYERTRALYENQNASKQELDSTRAQFDSARAALGAASQQVQLVRRQLQYTHLQAPGTGIISTVTIEENENVQAGETVASLQIGEQIEVSVNVPQSVISSIKKGDAVSVRFDALKGKEFRGEAVEVGVATVQGGSTFPVTLRLIEDEDQVRAGMSANVTFQFQVSTGAGFHIVPGSALGEANDGRFVFVLGPDGQGGGTVHRRTVEVGDITNVGIEIRKGLEAGELVVTAGVSKIQDGLKVRAPDTEKEPEPEPAPAPADGASKQAEQPKAEAPAAASE